MSDYMMGDCHHLAVAFHRYYGFDLACVAGMHGGAPAVFHVFALDPDGNAWDARGSHAPSDLVDEQEAMDGSRTWIVRLSGEADVWRMSRGDDALLNPISVEQVEDALDTAFEVLGRDPDHDPDLSPPKAGGPLPDVSEGAAWVPAGRRSKDP